MASTLPQITWLNENREKIVRYAFILQFVAALPFLLFAYSTGKVHARLLLKSATTTGTIVASVPVQFSSGSQGTRRRSYEAVVVFVMGDEQFRFQEWKATSYQPNVGTHVPVLFDPADPDTAMVDRGDWNFLPWAPCAAIGLLLFLVALKGLLTLFLSSSRQ
jgi:hypothetical protein